MIRHRHRQTVSRNRRLTARPSCRRSIAGYRRLSNSTETGRFGIFRALSEENRVSSAPDSAHRRDPESTALISNDLLQSGLLLYWVPFRRSEYSNNIQPDAVLRSRNLTRPRVEHSNNTTPELPVSTKPREKGRVTLHRYISNDECRSDR